MEAKTKFPASTEYNTSDYVLTKFIGKRIVESESEMIDDDSILESDLPAQTWIYKIGVSYFSLGLGRLSL